MNKRIFSGIQPTGSFTLGNYLGAIKNWVTLQTQYDCIYCIVNQHAITVYQEPKQLQFNTRASAALTIACGVDVKKSVLFIQSDVSVNSELCWALSCNTSFGELSRMTQFKDKSLKHTENVGCGLFSYPVLMASDILSYDAALVPVGEDQRQHLELARNIAVRFNHIYGDTFVVPEGYFPKVAAKVMSLTQPTSKMSKSDTNQNATVLLTDDKDTIIAKFKRAITDNEGVVSFREDGAGVANLMTIYSAITGKNFDDIEKEFAGVGYGIFKISVAEAVYSEMSPIQDEYTRIMQDPKYLDDILKRGALDAYEISLAVKQKVYEKIGLLY